VAAEVLTAEVEEDLEAEAESQCIASTATNAGDDAKSPSNQPVTNRYIAAIVLVANKETTHEVEDEIDLIDETEETVDEKKCSL
jgi:hypothetical protein